MEYSEALKLLNLKDDFNDKELKSAYLKMSKVYHPDLNGDEEIMKKINEARDILSNISIIDNIVDYHKELVMKLNVKLANASVRDINYIKIKKIIDDFINIDINNKGRACLHQEFINVENKIMDIYIDIKEEFYKKNNIPKDFICSINFTGSLLDLYSDLNKAKINFIDLICKNIIINNIDSNYYSYMKDKINIIINSVCNKYYDTKNIKEIINIVNTKVNYMYIIYEDALNIIDNIYRLINEYNDNPLIDIINKEISSMNNDYYTNYGRLNEILVSVGLKYGINLRKNIKVKEFVCNNYKDNNIIRRMLLDINYVNIGLISKDVIDIILSREYKDVIEYNNSVFDKLNNKGVVYINNKLISNYDLCIGTLYYKDNNKLYINGIIYDKEYFLSHYETLELFLRDIEFIGELVNNSEVLLYTNNIIGIYLVGDKLDIRYFNKCRGIRVNHVDVDKYQDKLVLRKKILDSLVNDKNYER